MALFGPPDVSKMEASCDVRGLINALSYKKDSYENGAHKIRWNAADALARIGVPAVDALLTQLEHPIKDTRRIVIEALGKIGDERAIQPLIDSVRNSDSDIADWTAIALSKFGSQTLAPLFIALKDKDPLVRSTTANALGRIQDTRAIIPLIAVLNDPDNLTRYFAVYALSQFSDARVIEPLASALEENDSEIRRAAAIGLGKLGDKRAVNMLVNLLLNSEWFTLRKEAAQLLGALQDVRAIEPLKRAVYDKEECVSQAAGAALQELYDHNIRLPEPKPIAKPEPDNKPNVFDVRSDNERMIESRAIAGDKLDEEVEKMVAELIQIGRTEDFRSTRAGGNFDKSWNHIRAREIGEILNANGGMELMKAVYYRVTKVLPGEKRSLEGCWSYVGEWRA